MKSKISFFNKTIFKKNFTHYWPLWAVYLLYLIAVMPVNLFKIMRSDFYVNALDQNALEWQVIYDLLRGALNPFPIFLFSTVAVMAVFSYLYTAKNAFMIHALPVNRRELFFTNVLSGFSFLVIPEAISFIIAVFVGIACGVAGIQYLFLWLLYVVGITFFAVSISTFVAMFTGNLFAMPVYCVVANYLYVGLLYTISAIIGNISYGISFTQAWRPGKSCVLSPLYYINNNVRCRTVRNQITGQIDRVEMIGGGLVLGYVAAAIVILAAAFWLYKRHQLETAGDIISIPAVKPIFRWGSAIGGGFLLANASIFFSMNQSKQNFWILLLSVVMFGSIGFWTAEMLMQKSFRVFRKKRLFEWAAAAAVSVLILAVFKLDVFGVEKRLPEAEEVERGYVNLDYPILFLEDELSDMIDIHAQIIDAKDEYLLAEKSMNMSQVTFRYYLKDGDIFERSYSIPVTEEYIYVENTPTGRIIGKEKDVENLKKNIFGKYYEENEYYSGYMEFYGEDGYDSYRFSEEEMNRIVEAAIKDMEAGNYEVYLLYSIKEQLVEEEYFNSISLNYVNKISVYNESDYYYYYDYNMYDPHVSTQSMDYMNGGTGTVYLSFGKKCTNLIETLEELNIVNEERRLCTYEEYETFYNR